MSKQCLPKPPAPREMTPAELDAAFVTIRKEIDKIVKQEQEKAKNEAATA